MSELVKSHRMTSVHGRGKHSNGNKSRVRGFPFCYCNGTVKVKIKNLFIALPRRLISRFQARPGTDPSLLGINQLKISCRLLIILWRSMSFLARLDGSTLWGGGVEARVIGSSRLLVRTLQSWMRRRPGLCLEEMHIRMGSGP